jgi:hypothetical protein
MTAVAIAEAINLGVFIILLLGWDYSLHPTSFEAEA